MPESARGPILVCFAVPDEARPFRPLARKLPHVRLLVTGMGHRNAAESLRRALAEALPQTILTCGYAGALRPDLRHGQLVSDAAHATLQRELAAIGALPMRFHCSDRIASTAVEKRRLHETTGADVVEMESGIIHQIARERGIPCATLRVISDVAEEDFPLDFNALQTADAKLSPVKLAAALLRSPGKIPKLIRFANQLKPCGQALAQGIEKAIQQIPA
jgi:nucleoside phosphorylase